MYPSATVYRFHEIVRAGYAGISQTNEIVQLRVGQFAGEPIVFAQYPGQPFGNFPGVMVRHGAPIEVCHAAIRSILISHPGTSNPSFIARASASASSCISANILGWSR